MPKREDDIRNEIERLGGTGFERFARELLSRELYPALNPTSLTYDLGEDARTESSTFTVNGKRVSLAISKEATLTKLKQDCDRCVKTHRDIDILVFVTSGAPRTDTVDKWKREVKTIYGWDLEVRSIEFLAPYASRPQNESLVDDYLNVPPPDGDYTDEIDAKFGRVTKRYLYQIDMTIPGMSDSLPRDEVDIIEEQLAQGRHVILTGEAGTGKSGIAALLAKNSLKNGKHVLLLDGRLIGNLKTEGELRKFFDLNGSVSSGITRINNSDKGCLVIIDQLDNIAGSDAARLIKDLITECLEHKKHLQVMIICRNKEQHESVLLKEFISLGFIEITCREINSNVVELILKSIGIDHYSPEVIELGKNLLNLAIIGQIHIQEPSFDFTGLTDEVLLWEVYINTWIKREGSNGEEMIKEVTHMAVQALNDPEGIFEIIMPASPAIKRLISWGIVTPVEGTMYRFRHDKFQDFIYARNAADRLLLPKEILSEILEYKSNNVFTWVNALYDHRKSGRREAFLRELFDV